MTTQEYRLEVWCQTTAMGEEIWNPVGYEAIFDNFKAVENFKIERQHEYPNKKYRIVGREVSEWEVVE